MTQSKKPLSKNPERFKYFAPEESAKITKTAQEILKNISTIEMMDEEVKKEIDKEIYNERKDDFEFAEYYDVQPPYEPQYNKGHHDAFYDVTDNILHYINTLEYKNVDKHKIYEYIINLDRRKFYNARKR